MIYRNPNDGEYVIDGYWKVNNKLEIAASSKAHIIHPDFMGHNQEIATKYKYSNKIACIFKTDLAGNMSTGFWLKEKRNCYTVSHT